MPEDYYPSNPGSDRPKKADDSEEPEEKTALIPKSLLMGKDFKPGEEVIFKIVHLYEDEVEIAYATEEKKDKSEMDKADDKMDEMAASNTGSDNPGNPGY